LKLFAPPRRLPDLNRTSNFLAKHHSEGGRKEHLVFSRQLFRSRRFWIAVAALLVIILSVAVVLSRRQAAIRQPIVFSDFLQEADAGRISAVVANGDHLDITRTDGSLAETTTSANYVTANIADLRKNGIKIEVTALGEPSAYSYGALLLGVAFIGMLGLSLYRVTSGRIPALW